MQLRIPGPTRCLSEALEASPVRMINHTRKEFTVFIERVAEAAKAYSTEAHRLEFEWGQVLLADDRSSLGERMFHDKQLGDVTVEEFQELVQALPDALPPATGGGQR